MVLLLAVGFVPRLSSPSLPPTRVGVWTLEKIRKLYAMIHLIHQGLEPLSLLPSPFSRRLARGPEPWNRYLEVTGDKRHLVATGALSPQASGAGGTGELLVDRSPS